MAVVVLAHGVALLLGAAGTARLLATTGIQDWAWAIAGAVEFVKAVLPVVAWQVWAARGAVRIPVGGVLLLVWVIVVGLSFMASEATISGHFAGRERVGQHAAETRAGLRADLADAERWMTTTARDNPRPVDAVMGAQQAALARVPAWIASATGGCKSGIDADQRFVRSCGPVRELERELGAARGYEAARARVTELRQRLTAMAILENADPLAATAAAIAQFVGLSGGTMIALLAVGAWEFLSWVGVTTVIILFGQATGSSANGMLRNTATGIARDGPIALPEPGSDRPRSPARDDQAFRPVRRDSSVRGRLQGMKAPVLPAYNAARTIPVAPWDGSARDASAIAVREFVGMLELGVDSRATATELFQCYDAMRAERGWPRLSQAKFGRLARPALESIGVQRVKANIVVYNGVRIPEALRVKMVQQ